MKPALTGLGAGLLLAVLALPVTADSDEYSATAHLESAPLALGGTTLLTVRSPLVGASVFVAGDLSLGPLFAGSPTMPVLQMSSGFTVLGAGSIDGSGRFEVTIPTPLAANLHVQAVVVDAAGRWIASNPLTLRFGASSTFASGTGGLDPATGSFSATDVDWADLDKDGCPDAVVANDGLGARPLVLMGDCTGALAQQADARLPLLARRPTACVEIADVNNDSWPDLFLGGGFGQAAPLGNLLLVNDRRGGFKIASGIEVAGSGFAGLGQLAGQNGGAFLPPGKGVAVDAEFGDVDGDGDVDLLVTNLADMDHPGEVSDPVMLYRNQGGAQGGKLGRFAVDAAFALLPDNQPHVSHGDSSLGDVDNDGDLDVWVSSANSAAGGSQSRLYVNDGAGTFTDVTDTALPVGLDKTFEADFGDFDGDGDLDVFVANNAFSDSEAIHLFENVTVARDQPLFVDGSSALPGNLGTNTWIRISSDVGDVDFDGDLDIVVGIHELPTGPSTTAGSTKLLVNQGATQLGTPGTFVVHPQFLPPSFVAADVALGDADADGDLDVYLANTGKLLQLDFQDQLWINNL